MKIPFLMRLFLLIGGLTLLCGSIWFFTRPSDATSERGSFHRTLFVKVMKPEIKAMPVQFQTLGKVAAAESVAITPQIGGILKKIYFQQGETVHQNQLLFEIDGAVYLTQVEQMNANLQRDQAQLAVLQATKDRYAALVKLDYVTRQQYEEAIAAAKAQAATVAADSAQLNQAKIQLNYTTIRAPISGKTSMITVHVGDLITANNPTPLLTINRMNPATIDFNIPQNELPSLLHYQKINNPQLAVLEEQSGKVLTQGVLTSINNTVDAQTGTVALKATVTNPNLILWPGQLVTVRLTLGIEPHPIVIPIEAVQIGQKGHYVYVVKNGIVLIQPVTIARENGEKAVVAAGLTGEESVIIEIPPNLRPGEKVNNIPDVSIEARRLPPNGHNFRREALAGAQS